MSTRMYSRATGGKVRLRFSGNPLRQRKNLEPRRLRLTARGSSALALLTFAAAAFTPAKASDPGTRLIRAYPEFLSHVENGELVWRDGTRMRLSDGRDGKTPDQLLDAPDLDDMFAWPYPKGRLAAAPQDDPGRVRYAQFFQKMYGDCTKGGVSRNLSPVEWLPGHGGGKVQVTRVNGVDKALAKVSLDLAKLPPQMIGTYLIPSAGTYNCRVIAKTNRTSAHGYGIAIDIATSKSDYWQWSSGGAYRNRIPYEIVEIFERHGFIWGGKWKSFDTMHFEYRPELLID
jgi:D-alanyl-D-alanine carboxypeptidase